MVDPEACDLGEAAADDRRVQEDLGDQMLQMGQRPNRFHVQPWAEAMIFGERTGSAPAPRLSKELVVWVEHC